MNYVESRTSDLQKLARSDLIALIVNEELNDLIAGYADYGDDEDPHGHGKRVPYIGWYWRSIDVAGQSYFVGDCGDFRGFMENNKWGYPERRLLPEEAAQVTEIICAAKELSMQGGILADIASATENKLAELWPLLQTFPMTVEGYWIYGPQGQVGFAESSESADRTIVALQEAAPGLMYRKVKA